jgi:mannose-1-phosphate guanylyltransferase
LIPCENLWFSVTEELVEPLCQEFPEIQPRQLLVEPLGRNTAPAIGAALLSMPEEVRRGVVAVLPADHRIACPEAFRRTLQAAFEWAERTDQILTLGVRPSRAETGYGYLELGQRLEGEPPAWEVTRFREKPDRATAEAFVSSGRYLWNAGIFVFRGERMLQELRRFAPDLASGLEAYCLETQKPRELYARLPSISIDYAVMEKATSIAALELDCGWSDLGSWEAVFEVLPTDPAGNCSLGEALFLHAQGCLVVSPGATTVVLGAENLVVVRTEDVVFVLPRSRSQEVREVLRALEQQGRLELL